MVSEVSENQMRTLDKKTLILLHSIIFQEKAKYFEFSFFCYEHSLPSTQKYN